MQIELKHNVGDKIIRTKKCFATVSHSGSCTEQMLRITRIIIDRGTSFNRWKPIFHYECQDMKSGNFVRLDDEEINECSNVKFNNEYYKEFDYNCRQLDLIEVYKPTSKSQYERFLQLLQEKNIICKGYMDDYNCVFEIRFR